MTCYDPTLSLSCTGLKHQIRVHLADGLRCPVLGDHKFGGPLLREDVALRRKVEAMGVAKGHVYLHAMAIEVASYHGQDRPLKIEAPLPDYYSKAIMHLQLKKTT